MRYPRKAKKGPTIETDEKESKAEVKRERASVGGEKAAEAKERKGYRRGGFVPKAKGRMPKRKSARGLVPPPPMGGLGMAAPPIA